MRCYVLPCARLGQEGAFKTKLLSINSNACAQQDSMGIASLSKEGMASAMRPPQKCTCLRLSTTPHWPNS